MTSVQDHLCIFCNESFEDKETLQIHFRKHGDPKFDQTTKIKGRSQNDSPTSVESPTPKDDSETVACDVCEEVFPTISKAITHKHKVHPDHDAKYFCPWCGKLFTLKHLYNKHLQSAHDATEVKTTECFHCDSCNVDFFIPSAMIYHNKFFHRQDTDIPAIGHSKKLKLVSQELVQIYYCPFCGEEYNNKINLHKHMTDDHSDEDQSPENIMRCPLCEAVFYHLDAYELHLTFHTSEDLYTEDNEMLKQIVEFSLDTVPPLMEKMDMPPDEDEGDDVNAMGIDQFLQLTMSKDPDDEVPENLDRVKAKKHKKHKKSKKTITLDEFLNMNSDVFGEGLNVQGIEEVPSRIVTKQLKAKKEHLPQNNQRTVLPSEIDKLKKQGISIKMKSGKGPVTQKFNQRPSTSAFNRAIPVKSNVISTSSEVLSKLMNQSNSQVRIIKRGPSAANVESAPAETTIVKEPNNSTEESVSFNEGKEMDNGDNKTLEEDDITEDKLEDNATEKNKDSLPDANFNDAADEQFCHKSPDSTSPTQCTSSNDAALATEHTNKTENSKGPNIDDANEHLENSNINNKLNDQDMPNNSNKVSIETPLHDFEEELTSTKILRDIIADTAQESQLGEASEKTIENDVNESESSQDVASNTLSAIKHLSGLITVKPFNNSMSPKEEGTISSQNQVDSSLSEDEDKKLDINSLDLCKQEIQKESANKTLNALKNLSKHVTIKPLSSQVSSPGKEVVKKANEESDNEQTMYDGEDTDFPNDATKNIVGKKVVNLKSQPKPKSATNNSQPIPAYSNAKISAVKKSLEDQEESRMRDGNIKSNLNADLLKRLTNVTAKPIPSTRNLKQPHTFKASKQTFNARNIPKQQKIDEEIEIFNIDDSDSDGQEKQDEDSNKVTSKAPTPPVKKPNNFVPKSHDALRSLGKNITVKPKDQQTSRTNQNSFTEEDATFEHNASFSDEDDDFDNICKKMNNDMNQFINKSNKMLESTLKNLGKHITVKPRNLSPSTMHKKHMESFTEQTEKVFDNDTESDSDNKTDRVKITEITDQNASDNDFHSEDEERNTKSYVTQSPDGTYSDTGENFSEDEHFDKVSDMESNSNQTTPNTKPCDKPYHSPSSSTTQSKESQKCPLNTFKKLNREITIKSLKDKQNLKDSDADTKNTTDNYSDSNTACPPTNQQTTAKQFRQNTPKYNTKLENQSMQQGAYTLNDKATSSNQINTVNKEVSVKTFQSQTVIEEITTTVTKTIRTVKQEVKSATQTNTLPNMKSQKILNYNRPAISPQNVNVRHPSPSIGTKIKNASPINRSNTNSIRPSNQLVPVRTGFNMPRPCNPTMIAQRNIGPKPFQQKPNAGSRPLKISPQAMGQTVKRSSQESTSQFSCFKKPRESLSADGTMRHEQEGEASMHLTTSQSRSDFTTTVKNAKGRSMVTATQMKSEISTSSHLNKLGNVSGLKIMKTTSKQATQVEERVENVGAKRTMEALQKLQMQGLLVKRPRTDADNASQNDDFSNSESENEEDAGDK